MSQPQVVRFAIRFGVAAWLALAGLHCPAAATKKLPPHPININTANSEELQQVPGIGPVTAEKILQKRKSYGAFKSVEDLKAVRGMGPKRFEKMSEYLTVGKPAPHSPKVAAAMPAVRAAPIARKTVVPLLPNATKKNPDGSANRAERSADAKPADSQSADAEDEEPELR